MKEKYRFQAMRILKTQTVVTIFIMYFSGPLQIHAQLSDDSCKFLGNITSSSIRNDFTKYWNQVTPENGGKWASVEASKDVMNWNALDLAYNFAKSKRVPFKQHTFIWGQQQPAWISSLSAAEQKAEVEEWMELFAERYPDVDYIDVVNEPLHAPPSYSGALGGNGTTGWDWVVWSFKKARALFPNAKLLLNDYNIINNNNSTDQYIGIINVLKDSGLIDGIGEQGHFYETTDLGIIISNLVKLINTGLPIYISEFDLNISDDSQQLQRYQSLFPIFWETPDIKGVTLWGYVQYQIWRQDAYLIRSDGSERPAMSWLRTYIENEPFSETYCYNGPIITGIEDSPPSDNQLIVYPNPMKDGVIHLNLPEGTSTIKIMDLYGRQVLAHSVTAHQQELVMHIDLQPNLYVLIISGSGFQKAGKILIE